MRNSLVLGFLSALTVLSVGARAAEYQVVVAQLDRKVEISRNEGVFEPAVAGMKLSKGDRVHTGFKSTCVLGFPDGSLVEVQPMSLLQLDKIDVSGIATRARMLLRTGEVKAQVNRSTGARGDFQVQTPTTTASVRGTEINRISYDESAGTQIRMGGHGLLAVLTPHGHAFLRAHRNSSVRQAGDTPMTPGVFARNQQTVNSLPQGSTENELADARQAGVPRAGGTGNDGPGALITNAAHQSDAFTVTVVPQPAPVVVTQPPLIPTPFPLPPQPPTREVPTKPGNGTTRIVPPGN